MPRFFVESLCDPALITGEDARHISRSLRMQTGEGLTLCDGRGSEADGVIEAIAGDAVTVRLGPPRPSASEPATRVSLYLAVSKGDKPDLVVQKAGSWARAKSCWSSPPAASPAQRARTPKRRWRGCKKLRSRRPSSRAGDGCPLCAGCFLFLRRSTR